MDNLSTKMVVVGASLFLLTLGWAYFLDVLALTPQSMLQGIGHSDQLNFLFSFPFAAFILFFAASVGITTAYADKDERSRVYTATIAPVVVGSILAALLFHNFSQWYPLALFYFGAIPLMIETTRLKRLELKNFVVARSSFSGAQRGLQIVGVGILVTLAITALPQNNTLYQGFEDAFFSGKVVQQVNVEKLTTDFLISTQRGTLTQILNTDAFQHLRDSNAAQDTAFVTLMDQTLENVNSASYRAQVSAQIKNQQDQIDPQALIAQLQQTIPGYSALKSNYWAIAAFLASLIYFIVTLFVLQPLAALIGTGVHMALPGDRMSTSGGGKKESSVRAGILGLPFGSGSGVKTDKVTGWSTPPAVNTDISTGAAKSDIPAPEFAHKE